MTTLLVKVTGYPKNFLINGVTMNELFVSKVPLSSDHQTTPKTYGQNRVFSVSESYADVKIGEIIKMLNQRKMEHYAMVSNMQSY